jgi:hypothetical protein
MKYTILIFIQLHRAHTYSARDLPRSTILNPILTSVGKSDPHIRILAAFPGPGWGKSGGKNSLG